MDTQFGLHQDFREFLQLLERNEVEYLIVGGYAVGIYGYPRPTGDLDIWVSGEDKNAVKLVRTLTEFGFVGESFSKEIFYEAKSLVQIGFPPVKIELMTHIDGVNFQEAIHRKSRLELDGMHINVISLDDLKRNKKASGRLKDLADLENLP